MRSEVARIRGRVARISVEVARIYAEVARIQVEVARMHAEVARIQVKVARIGSHLKNDYMSDQLNTIYLQGNAIKILKESARGCGE